MNGDLLRQFGFWRDVQSATKGTETDSSHKRLHDIEGDELALFARYGINDPVALAEAFYANTGDHSKCIQIIQEARE